ncbi:MAG: adenylate kinase [Cytophagaceae bacterium]|jgi:adenylate kinase|nr:adenylate kinase [Cytophagaceae bacterium]
MINLVLFGPPGAGKGTQSEKIIAKYGFVHLSTGDLFRKHLSEGTELGLLAKKYMNEGNLVPDEVVIKMVGEKIKENPSASGVIFDGFPRTVPQAQALDALLASMGQSISGMVGLEVPEEELKIRIRKRGETSGRADDQEEEKINNRIKVYNEETIPVANFYAAQKKYHPVQGVGEIETIFNAICSAIDSFPN